MQRSIHSTATEPPLVSGEPIREWAFSELRGDSLEEVELDDGIQVGGLLHELHDFGPTFRDSDVFDPDGSSLPSDGITTGQIASTADGITYWVGAEAPAGIAGLPEDPIGGRSQLRQTQSFIKRTADASLTFTVSAAFIETTDLNAFLGRSCPPAHADGLFCDLVKGELFLDVQAFTVPAAPDIIPFDTFFHVAGGATVSGFAENWDSDAWTTRYSQVPLWDVEDFDFVIDDLDGATEGLVLMILRESRPFTIDLSSVEVGQAFTLQSFAMATAYNRIAGPPSEFGSSATAFLRDPQGTGGTAIAFSGLEPTDVLSLDPPAETPVEPAPCPPGSTGEAGTLQFSADRYSVGESNSTPTVRVTRTGGSTGPVTATVTTSDGSAVAGTDYTPVHASVLFADGDATPRAVEVPVLADQLGEGDRSVILTLTEPGGCATLGSPATAELIIRDDDPAPPRVQPYGLDPAWGTGGKATTTAFGGDRSSMALQPDGKVVLAGGTFTAFVLARFDVDGTLDDSFGTGGLVTTNIGGSFSQQEALGVAIQPDPDGRIVVAGYIRNEVAVACYQPDGQLDETFGTDGVVSGIVTGLANDVTIQPDGRIVIAGRTPPNPPRGDDFDDLYVARLLADGQLDGSFGGDGLVVTDVGGLSNEAQNVVVQPADEMIVLSGSSRNPGSSGVGIDHHTDLARYGPNGQPDPTFGNGGALTLDAFVGADLAVQPDGRLLLVGTADTTPPISPPGSVTELSVMRLEPDGSPDETFGDHGTTNVSVTALTSVTGDPGRDGGAALALQPDGRIVIAGATGGPNSNFAVARLLPDGTLDPDFTDTGVMTIDFFGFTDLAESVAVTDDGSILVSGLARDNVDGYGVARL
ncbi:MAG TPA: Calx-beta domain-containing protein, partial [Acidimicrobiales bacterium]